MQQKLKLSSSKVFDLKKLKSYPKPFIGIDEVGRGCLAGPVCAGVVILNEDFPYSHFLDSKTIKETSREILSTEILKNHYCAIGWASNEEIDQINIRQATFLAMGRALVELLKKYSDQLDLKQGTLLIDGRDQLPFDILKNNPNFKCDKHSNLERFQQQAIVKGDQHLRCISAASIIAKVARDGLMQAYLKDYPEYGFEKHKGYGTRVHRNAIKKYRPLAIHRKTFAGVKEHL